MKLSHFHSCMFLEEEIPNQLKHRKKTNQALILCFRFDFWCIRPARDIKRFLGASSGKKTQDVVSIKRSTEYCAAQSTVFSIQCPRSKHAWLWVIESTQRVIYTQTHTRTSNSHTTEHRYRRTQGESEDLDKNHCTHCTSFAWDHVTEKLK